MGGVVCRAFLLAWILALPMVCIAQPNLLVLIADDTGVGLIGSYGESSVDVTPNIDTLAAQGVLFRNAWSAPLCSATRSTILTGRYGFRTGVGAAVPNLQPDELTLPQAIPAHRSLLTGKWHVSGYRPDQPPASIGYTPVEAGFSEFRGTPSNFYGEQYFWWTKVVELVPGSPLLFPGHTVYATTDVVDDAIEWIGQQSEPWFIVVSFHAIHAPLQVPPEHLHTQQAVKDQYAPGDYVHQLAVGYAMLEAMDTEFGRLIGSIDLASTTVVFVGDNGSDISVPDRVNKGGKSSLWEGGINVPLVVAGAGVTAPPGSETSALAHTTDLFATLAELAGASVAGLPTRGPLDAVSLLPVLADPGAVVRTSVYTDGTFNQAAGPEAEEDPRNHGVAIRDDRYKLIRQGCLEGRDYMLYDLLADPGETTNLWDDQDPQVVEARDFLRNELALITGEGDDCPPPYCSDGIDNDGDGLTDYPEDSGCVDAASYIEDPACQDGIDNDGDGLIDFDGGLLVLGYVAADPDPQCIDWPSRDREKKPQHRCGLGAELAFVLPSLIWLWPRPGRRAGARGVSGEASLEEAAHGRSEQVS